MRISKGGDLFALPEHIDPYLRRLFADLAHEGLLRGLGRERFVERLAHYYAELNAVHPFGRATVAPNAPFSVSSPRPLTIRSPGLVSMLSAMSTSPARVIAAATRPSGRCSTISCRCPVSSDGATRA